MKTESLKQTPRARGFPLRAGLLLPLFFFTAFLYARGADDAGAKALTIYTIKGPSGVGMIRLFEEVPRLNGFDVKVEALAHADLMAARFISGEARVGILPPNAAAKIRASGRDIKIAALTGTGMVSLLTSDPAVTGIKALAGKNVAAAGQGVTPDLVFRKILAFNGLNPEKDLFLNYSLAHPEIAQSLIAGRISTALLPEPFASMARLRRPDLKDAADIGEEWIKAGGAGNYPMTVLVVDGAFAASEKDALREILGAVKASIEWVKARPAEAGALAEKHGLGPNAGAAAAAVPKSGYVFIPAAEARPSLESLFRTLLESAPSSIGGALPPGDFYLAW